MIRRAWAWWVQQPGSGLLTFLAGGIAWIGIVYAAATLARTFAEFEQARAASGETQ